MPQTSTTDRGSIDDLLKENHAVFEGLATGTIKPNSITYEKDWGCFSIKIVPYNKNAEYQARAER